METFFALLALCAGNSLVTGEFPAQRPVTRSFDVFFGLRLSKRLSKQSWGWWFETLSRPSWRHCNEIGQPDPRVDPYWLILCIACTFCKDSIKYSWLWFVVINDQCMLSFAHPLLCWCRCGSRWRVVNSKLIRHGMNKCCYWNIFSFTRYGMNKCCYWNIFQDLPHFTIFLINTEHCKWHMYISSWGVHENTVSLLDTIHKAIRPLAPGSMQSFLIANKHCRHSRAKL